MNIADCTSTHPIEVEGGKKVQMKDETKELIWYKVEDKNAESTDGTRVQDRRKEETSVRGRVGDETRIGGVGNGVNVGKGEANRK